MIKIKKSLRMYVPLLLIFAMVSFAEAAEPMDIKEAIERVLRQNASLLSLRQEAAKAARRAQLKAELEALDNA